MSQKSSDASAQGISVSGLTFTYHNRLNRKPLFHNFQCEFKPGNVSVILGRSGCGKSSLLKLLVGLLRPTGNSPSQIEVAGCTLEDAKAKRFLGYLPQESNPAPWRTALENLCLPLELTNCNDDNSSRAARLLNELDLALLANQYPDQLSGGQKRRLAIGMCIVSKPRFLLLDEPFSGLDVVTRRRLCSFLLTLSKVTPGKDAWDAAGNQKTMIIVSHDIEEAALLGDEIHVISSSPSSTFKTIVNPVARRTDLLSAKEDKLFNDFVARLYSEMEA